MGSTIPDDVSSRIQMIKELRGAQPGHIKIERLNKEELGELLTYSATYR